MRLDVKETGWLSKAAARLKKNAANNSDRDKFELYVFANDAPVVTWYTREEIGALKLKYIIWRRMRKAVKDLNTPEDLSQ